MRCNCGFCRTELTCSFSGELLVLDRAEINAFFKPGPVVWGVSFGEVWGFQWVADLNSFHLGELEEMTWMPMYYMDEDYPAGSGITEPLPEWSNWHGSESSTLENDVYICCYALIVVHARNEWMNEWRVVQDGVGVSSTLNCTFLTIVTFLHQ